MSAGAPLADRSGVSTDDLDFMRRFEACEVSEAEWTHLAHVRVAWVALMSDLWPVALERTREGILQHNTVVLNRRHKYHETVTVAFARLVADRLSDGETWAEFERRIDDLLSAEDPVLLQYYTPGRLSADEARERFVEPDIRPLPDVA